MSEDEQFLRDLYTKPMDAWTGIDGTRLLGLAYRSLAPVQEGKETASPGWVAPEVRLALKVLLNHVEPGWENCKTVVEAWLEAAAPRKEGE